MLHTFFDGISTDANPVPTLHLGYERKKNKTRRELFRQPVTKKKKLTSTPVSKNSSATDISLVDELQQLDLDSASGTNDTEQSIVLNDHDYSVSEKQTSCSTCEDKGNLITVLVSKINKLTLENNKLRRYARIKSFSRSSSFTWKHIKTNAKMNFYTGISSIPIFNMLFLLIQPYIINLIYWKGPKYHQNFSKIRKRKSKVAKKLTQRDEFLLTLMRLRLGLLNEDLADRFGISPGLSSYIFTTWIRILSKLFRILPNIQKYLANNYVTKC